MRAPLVGRAHLGFGLLALLGFVALTAGLGSIEWYDTYVAAALDQWRGCDIGDRTAWITNTTPFVAVAFMVVGVVLALARGARVTDVGRDLAILTAGLLLAHGLKLVLIRDRPGLPPWSTAADSYPSGHMANITLCVGVALWLCRRRGEETPRVQLGMALAGVAAILTVAFTRVYLRRHWLSDVSASMLLMAGFVLVSSAPLVQRRTWRVVALAVALLLPVGTAIRMGWHIRLPSPSTFEDVLATRFLPRAEISGVELTEVPDDLLFQDLGEHRLHFTIVSHDEGRAVLRLLAQPKARQPKTRGCRWIALRVDGVLMPARRMSARWRTYAFPMPDLSPGHHDIDLAVVQNPDGLASGRDAVDVAFRGRPGRTPGR